MTHPRASSRDISCHTITLVITSWPRNHNNNFAASHKYVTSWYIFGLLQILDCASIFTTYIFYDLLRSKQSFRFNVLRSSAVVCREHEIMFFFFCNHFKVLEKNVKIKIFYRARFTTHIFSYVIMLALLGHVMLQLVVHKKCNKTLNKILQHLVDM